VKRVVHHRGTEHTENTLVVFLRVLCVSVVFSVWAPAQARYEQTRAAMGTEFTIVAYGDDVALLESAVNRAFDLIQQLGRRWSNRLPQSELSDLNRRAAREPVSVPADLFELLETSLRYSRQTGGAFDVTVGPLVAAWGFFQGTGRIPAPPELAEARARSGWRKLRLDPAARTVSFATPGMQLDLGGIGKGYALDRAGSLLRQSDITRALLTAGASSILALGPPPGANGWSVEIRDPVDRKKSAAHWDLSGSSLSTSGDYEKFFRAGGRLYGHIMDPRTGYPAQGTLSVSVVAATATESDALSTAAFVMGRQGTLHYLQSHPGIRVFLCSESGCEWLGGR